ncbi:MAG: glycosyltransferase family 4 protein, partial [Alkalinema sp. FL-bin-369]|nr:glycosyltransferase family 4 protein [Leptolyngbyaceae cyanobacterium LF-bin-369]
LLVKTEDVEALTEGMNKLMENPVLRQQFAQRAPEILDRFGMEKVMDDWALMMKL